MTQETDPSRASEIQLRPVIASDLPILFEHQQVPEANTMAAFPARDRDAFMAHWNRILGDMTIVTMTVLVDGNVAGHVGCWSQDGHRLVGYWIGQEYWGKGVATQMLSMFLCRVTERPLWAHVAKHNVASVRVLEKCGFSFCAESTSAAGEPSDGIEELIYVLNNASVGDP